MKTTVKIADTRQPSLTRAVIRQLGGRESLEDIARHGADGGYAGFTYYSDTVEFTRRNKALIMERLIQDASEFGLNSAAEVVAGFRCLNGMRPDEVSEAIHNPRSENRQNVFNALAWYAAEEIAREMNPDL